ncbi:hypothetical protein MKZ15_15520 [Paenibacillus sp. FSL R7-0216]|uniref:hypothetical protein n=1 Tax=Paenibacillus sp. FSL R7-0216 TaxID=2921677 RepID=UPI0030D94683
MGQDFAKFSAEIAKGINIKESNVELKLLIPLKEAQKHLVFLSSNQGEPVHVFLGDPQASLDFGEDDPMYQNHTGRWVTADSSGVVTKVEKPDGEDEDENQQTLFGRESEQEGDSAGDVHECTDPAGGEGVGDPEQAGSENRLDEDLPGWMTDGDDAGGDMEFTESGSGQVSDDPENELTDYEREIMGEVEISKEALEDFIIKNRPIFADLDVDLDFPTLLEKRRNGETWMGISKEIGIPSSQLNSKFRKYKDHVKKLMNGGGAA